MISKNCLVSPCQLRHGSSTTFCKKETECPLCLETVNNPETLPCTHSFCLKCLDKHANFARRQLQTTINCPVCQTSFEIPEGDSLKNLPASFHLNRLVDVLELKDGTAQVQKCELCEMWVVMRITQYPVTFFVPFIFLYFLLWSSPASGNLKRSSQCCVREITSARCRRVDPQTRHVFAAISRKSAAWILLWRMQGSYLY